MEAWRSTTTHTLVRYWSVMTSWLEADLVAAANPVVRKLRPWIVITNHYPLYCTLTSCNTPSTPPNGRRYVSSPPSIKTITPERLRHVLEPLLRKYKVDAVFVSHNHNYERTHAVANFSVAVDAPGNLFKVDACTRYPVHRSTG